MDSSIHLKISGKVQGVGFRWFVADQARRFGLSGWVKNLESGEVELVAHGESTSLQKFKDIVVDGPPGGHVEKVTSMQLPDGNIPNGFEIVR